jgi:hypothetical protein
MNERIKDLLEEAGFVSYGEDTGFYNIPAPAFLSRIDRLAELIVKECAGIAINAASDTNFITGISEADKRALSIAVEINKHFGVET